MKMNPGSFSEKNLHFFQFAMEKAPDSIIWMDSRGAIFYVNEKACRSLDYPREELLNLTVFDIDANYSPDIWPERWKNLKNRKSFTVESVHITKGGGRIPVEISVNYIEFEGRDYNCAFVRDISARKEAENSLRESEAKSRAVIDNANEAIFVAQDEVLKFVNPKTIEIIGYSADSLASMPFAELIHPRDRSRVVDRYRRRLKGERLPDVYPFRVIDRSGLIKWVEIRTVKFQWEGRPATLNFMSDITKRRRAEEMLKASLKEKDVLLREIHHRVKNNLQIISSLLRLQANNLDDPKARENLNVSRNRIKSMALIHESLYKSPNLSRIDFAQYVNKMTSRLLAVYQSDPSRILLKLNVVDIFLDIQRAVPLGQIINELISNSLKHAFPGNMSGEIEVSMTKDRNGKLMLAVKDNGVGMPDHLDTSRASSLGFQLIHDLSRQLGAALKVVKGSGVEIRLVIPPS